jgi:hypothetical protein
VFDGEARVRPRVKDAGLGNKVIGQLFDQIPRDPSLLAAPLERAPPKVGDTVPEPDECSTVCRHCVIFKEAGYDLPQPFPLFGERLMPTPSHFLLDFLELRPHAVATGFSLQREEAAARLSADERLSRPGLAPPAARRSERDTLASLGSHQANTPVIPTRQCTQRGALCLDNFCRNWLARILWALKRLNFRIAQASSV